MSTTDAGPFEHCSKFTKKSYRMTPRQLSKRVHETVENVSSALDAVQRPESKVHGAVASASVWTRRKSPEAEGGYSMRDTVCWTRRKVSKWIKSQKRLCHKDSRVVRC